MPRSPSTEKPATAKFDRIRDALEHVVENLICRGHTYILSVRGPREIKYNRADCFQVVAETMPYKNCELGLTIHLPFDPTGGVTQELLRFLECPIRHFFDKYVWSGIPCFILRFGQDTDAAERVMVLLLTEVYDYTTGTEFECEVSDEGPLDEDDDGEEEDSDEDEDEESDLEDESADEGGKKKVNPRMKKTMRKVQ